LCVVTLHLLSCKLKHWSKQFKWGRESVEDDPCPGRSVEVTTPEMCQKTEDMVMQDTHIKLSTIT